MNATLEGMARALFKSWFVDFDPVRAKMGDKQPFGMDAATAALFPSSLDDLPEGWTEVTLEKIAALNPETWGKNNRPDNIQYVDLANTKWGTIESTTHYSWKDAPSRAQRILRPGDTIIGTVRPGNGSFSFVNIDGLTGSTGFAVLRPKKPAYRELLYYIATSKDNIDRLSHLADGGAYPAVRPDVVLNTPFIFPSEEVVSAFSIQTAHMLDRVEANKQENKVLAQLRDYLLPRLISGDIRIPGAEKFVEAA
jgi:type I restriction enzyme S subunit